MASDWHPVSLGELCDAGTVEIQTGPFGSQLHAHEYLPDGIPVVPTEAIRNRRIDESVLPRISAEKAAELTRHSLKVGDILFARRGVQATGHIGFIREPEVGYICGTGAIRLRVNDRQAIDPGFLSHVLANPSSVAWFKFHAIGATMPNLNEGIIRSFSFGLPTLAEQKRIASSLSDLDDKIELNRKLNETLETMARALFKSWFVDFNPVRAKAEGRDPCLPAHIAALFPNSFEDSEFGEIPEGWTPTTLDEEFEITMGQSPPGDTYNDTGDGISFFQGRTDFGFRYPRRRVYCTAPTRFAEQSDTLVSVRAPVGDVNMASERCCIGRGVAAVRHASKSRSYTFYTMQSLRSVFDKFEGEGTVFGSISKKDFHAIKKPVPSSEAVAAFERLANPLDGRIAANLNESECLTGLRDLLLPKLISGDLQLNTGAPLVEATP